MALLAALAGCTKTGPQGLTGPEGPTGASGVANISSSIFSVVPGAWNTTTDGYGVNITDNDLSDASTDGVEVFFSVDQTTWYGLPESSLIHSGDNMEYAYAAGQVTILYAYSTYPSVTTYYKIVVIPPSIMKQNPNTNWHNYNQVNALIQAQAK